MFSIAIAWISIANGSRAGYLLLAIVPGMIWGFFRYGPMVVAYRAYIEKDWNCLEKLLSEVRRPDWLRPQDRAYFEFLNGELAMARGNAAEGLRRFSLVDPLRLRTDNFRSLLECRRAEAAFSTGQPQAAFEHLSEAKRIPHRPETDAEILRVEKRLQSS